MRILYIAGRWDPTVQNEHSGSDFGAFNQLKKQPETEVFLAGPFEDNPNIFEKIITKLYRLFSKKRWIKYHPSGLRKAGKIVNQAIEELQPDVIFSKYSAPLVHAKIDRPFVYMCDSTVKWTKDVWPIFSKLGFRIMENWEAKSIRECDRIITFSDASAEIIKTYYRKDSSKVVVMPIPAYVPEFIIPAKDSIHKQIGDKLHLLLVGKRFLLRGMDIAIETTQLLNDKGYPTELRIVGIDGVNQSNIRFLGNFEKEQPEELVAYFECFNWADLLIHPSRFHSAGIVISEAAAFGLPTITNAAGGLATSVQDDVTGIVLPENSSPSEYMNAIISLIKDEKRYSRYRKAARKRFDEKVNWDVSGKLLFNIIQEEVHRDKASQKEHNQNHFSKKPDEK